MGALVVVVVARTSDLLLWLNGVMNPGQRSREQSVIFVKAVLVASQSYAICPLRFFLI